MSTRTTLRELATVLEDVDRSPDAFSSAVGRIVEIGPWDRAAISLADPFSNSSLFIAECGFGPSPPFDLTESMSLGALVDHSPVATLDATRATRFPSLADDARRVGYGGILVSPIPCAPPELALWLGTDRPHRFTAAERRLASDIAALLGSVTESRRQRARRDATLACVRSLAAALGAAFGDDRSPGAITVASRLFDVGMLLVRPGDGPVACLGAAPARVRPTVERVAHAVATGAGADRTARLVCRSSEAPAVLDLGWWIPGEEGFLHLGDAGLPDAVFALIWRGTGPGEGVLRAAGEIGRLVAERAGTHRGLVIEPPAPRPRRVPRAPAR